MNNNNLSMGGANNMIINLNSMEVLKMENLNIEAMRNIAQVFIEEENPKGCLYCPVAWYTDNFVQAKIVEEIVSLIKLCRENGIDEKQILMLFNDYSVEFLLELLTDNLPDGMVTDQYKNFLVKMVSIQNAINLFSTVEDCKEIQLFLNLLDNIEATEATEYVFDSTELPHSIFAIINYLIEYSNFVCEIFHMDEKEYEEMLLFLVDGYDCMWLRIIEEFLSVGRYLKQLECCDIRKEKKV